MSESMLAGFFAINVKPEHRQAFVDASIFEAQSVISEEAGVFEFHIMMDEADPNRFYFYEVFRDEAALEAHRKTEVFKTWWSSIEPLIDGDLEKIAKMRSLFPTLKGFEAQKPSLLQW
ncbi:MAG: antibiotic biosynthesis monooxygenase [Paracoccaceae bacterium]